MTSTLTTVTTAAAGRPNPKNSKRPAVRGDAPTPASSVVDKVAADAGLQRAADRVAASIRRGIVSGELAVGENLPSEASLLQEYSVSRPTLREALRILESEDLITVRRGSRGGAEVRLPSVDVTAAYIGLILQMEGVTVEDVLATRHKIEVGAVKTLAAGVSAEWMVRLRESAAVEESALDNLDAFRRSAAEFHALLVEATENQTLNMLFRMISSITDRHSAAVAAMQAPHPRSRPVWRTKSHAVHTDLLDLIEAGKVEDATHLWRAHVNETNRAMTAQFGSRTVLELYE